MKKFISALKSNTAIYTYGVIFIFLIWAIISLFQGKGNVVFPNPLDTFIMTGEILSTSYIYKCIGWTLLRVLIGFSSSFLLALVLGILANKFNKFYTFFKPFILVLKSAPTAAFIYLFLILFTSKYASIFIIFLVSFPILYESVVGGLNNISKEVIDAMRIDSGHLFYSFLKIKIPLSFPYIAVGLLSSFGLAFKTSIMAEIISGSTDYGLGCAITAYRSMYYGNLTPIFSVTLICIVLVLVLDITSLAIKHFLNKK